MRRLIRSTTSLRTSSSARRNAWPIASLAVIVVVLTTAVVAFLGWRYAGLPIGAAIALGAIVAPPDAAAAGAVLRELRLPPRIAFVLQGESLLNDATALLIYRAAVTATVSSFSLLSDGPLILLSAAGSLVAGYLLARLSLIATARVSDIPSNIVLQFAGTFGAWLLADQLHLSPIITVVIYAMTLAQAAPRRSGARQRISSYSVWETAVYVVNVLAFVLMGLQARTIIERLSEAERWSALMFGLTVLAAVILVRIAWIAGYRTFYLLTRRWLSAELRDLLVVTNFRGAVLISWTGMRGLVTLATAFALPEHFPQRDLIVLCAFCVVLGTLVVQGIALKPLLRWLQLTDDGSIERQVSEARVAIMQAALDSLDGDASPAAAALRDQYTAARNVAKDPSASPATSTSTPPSGRRCIACARRAGSATMPSTACRKSWTGPSSMPRRPATLNPSPAEGADNLFRPAW